MLYKVIDSYFASAGLLSLLFAGTVAVYTVYQAIQLKKITSLVWLALIGLILGWSVSNEIIQWIAAGILLINSMFYIYFTIGFLLRKRKTQKRSTNYHPTISILIPARNEAKVLGATLTSLHRLNYPKSAYEVIVIDDSSTDETPSICKAMSSVMTNLKMIRNETALGKSVALNKTLETLDAEFVMILDADHLIDTFFIQRILINFEDKKVACVQGKNTIRNGKESLLSRLVQMEYLGRYEILYPGKPMALFMGSGAMFRTQVLKKVGGFNKVMLTEDLEVSYRIYESGNTILFDNTISTYELACSDFKNYFKQRHRWFRGIWQSFIHHIPGMVSAQNVSTYTILYFFYVIIENMALSSYLYTNALYALDFFGVAAFDFKPAVQIQTVVLGTVLGLGAIFGKRPLLLLFLPLAIFYYILFALPNLIAMIDNMLLNTAYKWNKTDRSHVAGTNTTTTTTTKEIELEEV